MHSRSSNLSEDAHSGRAAIPPPVQEDLDVLKEWKHEHSGGSWRLGFWTAAAAVIAFSSI